jgi:hypothetical protein
MNPATALKTPITVFEPALALKLVPQGTEQDIQVRITAVKNGRERTANKTLIAAVAGDQIEKAWLEVSADGAAWKRLGRPVYGPPYMFTVRPETLPAGRVSVRCAAADAWGNAGHSEAVMMEVGR